MKLDDVVTTYRWTNEAARQLYEACANELREAQHKRAVDLGISMDDGPDDATAFELLRRNRRLRMSAGHRAEVWEAWDKVINPLVQKMVDLRGAHTVPVIQIKT